MANWWGSSRSNYFRVKDLDRFKSWAEDIEEINILYTGGGLVAISGKYYGGWPHVRGEECDSFDLFQELSQHLADGEIAVLIEAGAEKLCYITGHAVAVTSRGEKVSLSLEQIY